jgi:hypothetical protein
MWLYTIFFNKVYQREISFRPVSSSSIQVASIGTPAFLAFQLQERTFERLQQASVLQGRATGSSFLSDTFL